MAESEKNAHMKGSALMSLRGWDYCLHVQRAVLFFLAAPGRLAALGLLVAVASPVAQHGL